MYRTGIHIRPLEKQFGKVVKMLDELRDFEIERTRKKMEEIKSMIVDNKKKGRDQWL